VTDAALERAAATLLAAPELRDEARDLVRGMLLTAWCCQRHGGPHLAERLVQQARAVAAGDRRQSHRRRCLPRAHQESFAAHNNKGRLLPQSSSRASQAPVQQQQGQGGPRLAGTAVDPLARTAAFTATAEIGVYPKTETPGSGWADSGGSVRPSLDRRRLAQGVPW
jgi:hypothetical protein